ncbi:MAG: RNA polymerase sigma factor [Planctomycetota bacterium]
MSDPPTTTSEALARRARDGDSAAWAALYRAHEDAIYGFLYHRLDRDRALTDDVFHDTFLRAVERIAQFDCERGAFGAWLLGIARNELRQRLRTRARRPTEPLGERDVPVEPTRGGVGEGVNLAFSALSPRHQTALAMKYHQGQSLEAIAAALDTTPAAVGSLLHRARAAFRAAYAQLTPGGTP